MWITKMARPTGTMAFVSLAMILLASSVFVNAATPYTLDSTQQQKYLDDHNAARRAVNPPAAYMPDLVWDDKAASVAAAYAGKCLDSHNANRTIDYGTGEYVGENRYWSYSSAPDYGTVFTTQMIAQAVKSWVDEGAGYTYSTGACSLQTCGHYTQVVWANSARVGCGAALCPTVAGLSYNNVVVQYCNYVVGGNYNNQKPYQTVGSPFTVVAPFSNSPPSDTPFSGTPSSNAPSSNAPFGIAPFGIAPFSSSPLSEGGNAPAGGSAVFLPSWTILLVAAALACLYF